MENGLWNSFMNSVRWKMIHKCPYIQSGKWKSVADLEAGRHLKTLILNNIIFKNVIRDHITISHCLFQPKFFRIGGRGYGSFRIEKHKISISKIQFPKLKKKSKLSCLSQLDCNICSHYRVEPWFEIVIYIMCANSKVGALATSSYYSPIIQSVF